MAKNHMIFHFLANIQAWVQLFCHPSRMSYLYCIFYKVQVSLVPAKGKCILGIRNRLHFLVGPHRVCTCVQSSTCSACSLLFHWQPLVCRAATQGNLCLMELTYRFHTLLTQHWVQLQDPQLVPCHSYCKCHRPRKSLWHQWSQS